MPWLSVLLTCVAVTIALILRQRGLKAKERTARLDEIPPGDDDGFDAGPSSSTPGTDDAGTEAEAEDSIQWVEVSFSYGSRDLSELHRLEHDLARVLRSSGAGSVDGHEISPDGGDASFFLFGKSAEAVFSAVHETLESRPFMHGAEVELRFGANGPEPRTFTLPLARA